MADNRIYNFSAGPSMLPVPVLERCASEMLNYKGSGMSVMEMSHRSKVYDGIITETEAALRRVLSIPDNYKVLFLQGGASTQFAAIPMNLLKTGKADYFYICANNTIYGTEYQYDPETPAGVPLVADMSSNILSKPVDVSKYGVIYAGAQKNMGPAGVTVVIVREDLLGSYPLEKYPVMLDWQTMANKGSMYNTPPTYGIYVLGLVLEWVEQMGGVKVMQERAEKRSSMLYDYLDSQDFYKAVAEKASRSHMNVTFRTGDDELDAKFAKESMAAGMSNLKGHRSVGGMRASIYNAMPIEGVEYLIDFMKKFAAENK